MGLLQPHPAVTADGRCAWALWGWKSSLYLCEPLRIRYAGSGPLFTQVCGSECGSLHPEIKSFCSGLFTKATTQAEVLILEGRRR